MVRPLISIYLMIVSLYKEDCPKLLEVILVDVDERG